jgi:hypothetical protein
MGGSWEAGMGRAGSAIGGQMNQIRSLRTLTDRMTTFLRERVSGGGPQNQEAVLAIRDRLVNEELRLLSERKRQVQDEAKTRQDTIQKEIQGARDRLKLAQQESKEARDRLLTAQERFGQMGRREQVRAISVMRLAERGGPQALSAEQAQILRGIGTERAVGFARQRDLEAGRRGGFQRFFGREERQDIRQAEARERRFQLDISDKRQIEIQVQRQDDQLVQNISREIIRLMDEQERRNFRAIIGQVERAVGYRPDALKDFRATQAGVTGG